ncbi:MAG: Fe(2+) transporter permease subunit FeoB [Rhodocyclaceae bacterium]|nr:Fe(2+) transporter permease subunit FeoB [Rhodocyclaceae bacterium]
MTRDARIALVGNPNCGKTTLFNALTGARQQVGNWPGVTVERKHGEYRHKARRFEVVDLPGTYSLDVIDGELSIDEQIARDYLHSADADLLVNVVDAANLERNLYLSVQLAETGRPMVVVLNMIDVARRAGITIDTDRLAARLGCPVIAISAARGVGIEMLREALDAATLHWPVPSIDVPYPPPLAQAIETLRPQVLAEVGAARVDPRWVAARVLEGDDLACRSVGTSTREAADRLVRNLGGDVDLQVADARYTLANHLAGEAAHSRHELARHTTRRIDRVVLDRRLGVPVFLTVMYLMFVFTINIGGAFVDAFDQVAGALLVDGAGRALAGLGAPDWMRLLLADGVGSGLQVVAGFIPIIGCLYLALSVLEDSGYMARAAFVMDRLMRAAGLPGKSFVPLIVGFGCNVPAVMSTRTLEQRRDRLLTMTMVPFMSCGARLPVYVLFAAAFFPQQGQNAVFALYLIGIALAMATGLIMKRTLLQGASAPFIMELPTYHLPTLSGVAIHTWRRLKDFVVGAGRVIVPMVVVINVLNGIGTDGRFDPKAGDRSVLAEVGRRISPAFAPLGLDADNWPAAVGIITGVLAKEAVVGTLDAAYQSLAGGGAEAQAAPAELAGQLQAALATIPANLQVALGNWRDPLGLSVGALDDREAAAAEQAVASSTFDAMASRFDGAAGAFAYLLFILLYMPCTATLAAIRQEAGGAWSAFIAVWCTAIAYGAATLCYQLATWARHPMSSAIEAIVVALGAVLGLAVLRRVSAAPAFGRASA